MEAIKIKNTYVVKKLFGSCIGLIFTLSIALILWSINVDYLFSFSVYLVIAIIVFPISFFTVVLRLMTFSYDLGADYINIRQGIISRQERHVPYSVIQNVIVKQDLLDRLFGLSTIVIENASMGGMVMPQSRGNGYAGASSTRYQYGDFPGMSGNMLIIPGLARMDAIKLRDLVLKETEKSIKANTTNQL